MYCFRYVLPLILDNYENHSNVYLGQFWIGVFAASPDSFEITTAAEGGLLCSRRRYSSLFVSQ